MKAFVIGLILLVCMMPFVAAQGLEIKSLKAYVDGEKDSGTLDVKPESEIKVKFDVENIDESDIRDIEITSVIKKIDDGEDLDPDEDAEVDDLDVGDDDSAEIVFQIPLEVDDDNYELEIKLEGKYTNGTVIPTVIETLNVDVKKEKHDIWIKRAELYNPALKCTRTTQLSVNVINMGTSDEDNTVLTIINEALGLSKRDTFDLDNDPFDSDSKFSNSYPITVANDQEPGTYPVNVKVTYSDGSKIAEKNIDLVVEACEKKATTVATVPVTTTTVPSAVVVQQGDVVSAEPEESAGIMQSFQSVIGNKGIFAMILLVELAVIIIGIVLVVSWVRKKD